MTTGIDLKIKLGLKKFSYVMIARPLISSQKILFIWYDSHRPTMPITNYKIKKFPWTTMIWHGADVYQGNKSHPVFTPAINIEDFNGEIKNAIIITIDMAGDYLSNKNMISRDFKESLRIKKILFNEYLTFADLMKSQGMSDFTKKHRKIRTKAMGTENITAKLIDVKLNKPENYIDFFFLTTATEPIYPDDFDFKNTKPKNNFQLVSDPSHTYTLQIRILEFFDWLNVFEGEKITNKEIKEILEVANIQVFSDDPSFHWQGMNYWISQLDGSIYPTTIKPKFWNRPYLHGEDNAFLSKHIQGLINQFKFFYNPMASMLNKKLKDKGYL